MFERFTRGARDVVEGAVGHAERADDAEVTAEHLLLALLDAEGTKAAYALAALGVTGRREAVVAALAEARRRGGVSAADEEALAGLGIDVGAIVSCVEQAHGEGALGRERTRTKRRFTGHRPFARESKDVLEQALRVAIGRGDRTIGDEHLLLALAVRPGVARDVLGAYGSSYDAVVRVLGTG
ncbi:Clp protease N-terminal domain-containing protein [Streptomyces sp. B-S-A8]|uniref:Clp protease N-terminal domain-containing protein n=1 Tax=Streptomyces solicavernae TaxID=3043614 RepID=A0ABT6RNE3_9ACTN|nr:Clp protease N-terminal domain-containing protein [Streptomyces sp. B-S-A8]MDI3385955.1 Clp protease N-terminal domain-containing protein [Streptomyces sp. B-S-A8]